MSKVLIDLDLLKYFSYIITSADYGIRKPHPLIFDMAVKKMQLPKSDIWYVGDSIETDILGAINANLKTIWYNQLNVRPDIELKQIEIKELSQIESIIKKNTKHNMRS
jgi:putative hydrolase of the HAD superfamily